MIKIILTGCNGRMGRAFASLVAGRDDAVIAAGVDVVATPSSEFPVYSDIGEFGGEADVLVDFSHKSALPSILSYCVPRKLPVVIATTGHDENQLQALEKASGSIPVFRSANMSLGVNLLADLVRRAASVLGAGFDIEIVEKHHAKKLDAPSGTALILADAAKQGLGEDMRHIYDRHAVRKERDKDEIGIHSVRGGTIIGEHEVIFAGFNEVVTLSHSAQSREVFASGALRAAEFIACGKAPGIYGMNDLLAEIV